MIVLESIKQLHSQIQAQPTRVIDDDLGIMDMSGYRFQFSFEYNSVAADAVVLLNITPYMMIPALKNTNQYFEFEMSLNFAVSPLMDNATYKRFVSAFKIKYDPNHKFSPRDFWNNFSEKIPKSVRHTSNLNPSTLSKVKPNLEEVAKIKFICFLPHGKNGKHVTKRNLEKTRLLLGEKAYVRCKNENISSCRGL